MRMRIAHGRTGWSGLAALATAALVVVSACSPNPSQSPAGSGAAAAASGAPVAGQFCSGTKIVFFPGGTPGGGFETVVYNGAKAAETAFGPTVTYQWSDWDPAKMVSQLGEAIATNPDGIAIMGHPGDDAYKAAVDEAEGKGIIVTSTNTQLPQLQAQYATSGFGYVGAVLHDAGMALANEAIRRGGLQSGDKAFVWGLVAQPGRGERTQGIIDGLEAAGLTVVYLEIDDATNADPSAGVPAFTGMATANPDLKAAFFDHGNVTSTIPAYMEAAGLDPGSVYTAGFDLSPATVQGVKDGYINLVIDQQQFLQGFLSVMQICMTDKFGFSGLMINTGGGFADKDNIDVLAPLVEQQVR
ncbi:MAG TPA: substrate-binding domain-containing protein [Candidatus Limnocylindrales bacterium]|nr:substrate-binding domain-containing protein [Candidatus Limnocylindrales bacterium]